MAKPPERPSCSCAPAKRLGKDVHAPSQGQQPTEVSDAQWRDFMEKRLQLP